jgi:hypothetical protein
MSEPPNFKGGEDDNLAMTDQTICEYVVNLILALHSDNSKL